MKIIFAMFGATRYWAADALQAAAAKVKEAVSDLAAETILAVDGVYLDDTPDADDVCVIMPMSGAVQAPIVAFAARYNRVILFAGYVSGNFDEALCRDMLQLNAAPTLMDTWAVLRREHPHVSLCVDRDALMRAIRVSRAFTHLQQSTLLLVGEIEPWVISASRDLDAYRPTGVTVKQVQASELIALFDEVTAEDALPIQKRFAGGADEIVEPTCADMATASRLAVALERLIERHNADGAAIACFNLIPQIDTTACLAVSYLNDCTRYVAACEGDVDSAVTMLMMRQLTDEKLWMANPNLQPDGTVNFTHCTAPLCVRGQECRYTLRSHHESGKGVSPQVDFPVGARVTLCRFSAAAQELTVQCGISVAGPREPSCRTQMRIQFDNYALYIETSLGCHQVMAFGDVAEDMRALWRSIVENRGAGLAK